MSNLLDEVQTTSGCRRDAPPSKCLPSSSPTSAQLEDSVSARPRPEISDSEIAESGNVRRRRFRPDENSEFGGSTESCKVTYQTLVATFRSERKKNPDCQLRSCFLNRFEKS